MVFEFGGRDYLIFSRNSCFKVNGNIGNTREKRRRREKSFWNDKMETVDGVEETSWEMSGGGGNGMTIILVRSFFFFLFWPYVVGEEVEEGWEISLSNPFGCCCCCCLLAGVWNWKKKTLYHIRPSSTTTPSLLSSFLIYLFLISLSHPPEISHI